MSGRSHCVNNTKQSKRSIMSARVYSPPIDLQRNSDLNSLPSCPSNSVDSNSLLSSGIIPVAIQSYPISFSSSTPKTLHSYPEILSARRNVSRNLFGSPDPRSAQFARDKIKEIRAIDKIKWNFDFDRETPLDGRYKWEQVVTELTPRVAQVSTVPPAYACHRLPFIASSSGCIKQFVRASSPTPCSSNQQDFYCAPIVTPISPKASQELLIVRPNPELTQSVSTNKSQAGITIIAKEYHQSTAKSVNVILPSSCIIQTSDLPTISVISHSKLCLVPRPTASLQLPSADKGDEPNSKPDDLNCKVQVKSTKQTQISDYMKLRKRKASQHTIAREKRAAP